VSHRGGEGERLVERGDRVDRGVLLQLLNFDGPLLHSLGALSVSDLKMQGEERKRGEVRESKLLGTHQSFLLSSDLFFDLCAGGGPLLEERGDGGNEDVAGFASKLWLKVALRTVSGSVSQETCPTKKDSSMSGGREGMRLRSALESCSAGNVNGKR
jgi:hypothetical protein